MNDNLCLERMRLETEIDLLRAFYNAWVEFHSIKSDDKWRRKHQELATQRMTEAHHTIMRFDQLYERGQPAMNGEANA